MVCFVTTYKVSINEIYVSCMVLFPAIIELLLYIYIILLKCVNSVFQSNSLRFEDFTSMTESPIVK